MSSKTHLTCCIKLQQVFILWHVSSSPAREMEKVEPRLLAAQDLKNGRHMPALHTPLDTSTSEIIPSTFTVTANLSLITTLWNHCIFKGLFGSLLSPPCTICPGPSILFTEPLFPKSSAVTECLTGTSRPELELSPSSDRWNHRRKEESATTLPSSVTTLQRLR